MKANITHTLYSAFLSTLVFTLWFGCSIESDSKIDPELTPLFELFIQEAEERGLDLSLQGIESEIVDIDEEGVSGQCVHFENKPDLVRIDKNVWLAADALRREFLVFHELGHCLLNQSHRDGSSGTNLCKTIMVSGLSGCTMVYSSVTRDGLLDELFYY